MTMTKSTSKRMIGLAVGTAMAGTLLSGCTTSSAPRADVSASQAADAMAKGEHDSAVSHAEAAVLASPRDAAYRATLGEAYLDAGRFSAAAVSFNDAMELGDNSARTALSLALSLTGEGKLTKAAALLNDWESEIAKSDLGLALALAGQPERGIHIMSNAIRGGQNTVKMRQNLAYAYALAGRWREARLMVAQDVPADKVSDRIEQWAELSHPNAGHIRVAALLGVPAGVRDAGQPVHLALANHPALEQLAAEASAGEAPAKAPEQVASAPSAELPATSSPDIGIENYETPASVPAGGFARAMASGEQSVGWTAPEPAAAPAAKRDAITLVSNPVVQAGPVDFAAQPKPRVSGQSARLQESGATRALPSAAAAPLPAVTAPASVSAPAAMADAGPAANGSHLVQLGSFSSEQGARRAWGIYVKRYPELADHKMVITQAVVRGKNYWRVSAGGFEDRGQSNSMCGKVKSNGDGCFSWAEGSPLPGAIDTGTRLARR